MKVLFGNIEPLKKMIMDIAEDEPVFLLRAKDLLAPGMVREYAQRFYSNAPATKDNETIFKLLHAHADAMIAWQNANTSQFPTVPVEEMIKVYPEHIDDIKYIEMPITIYATVKVQEGTTFRSIMDELRNAVVIKNTRGTNSAEVVAIDVDQE